MSEHETTAKVCKRCKTTDSIQWWKCCPEHTTEQGPDVLCESCASELHPPGDPS